MIWVYLYGKAIGDLELNGLYQAKSNNLGWKSI